VVVILDNGDEVFQGARGVYIGYMDEYGFGKHDHLLIIIFAHVGSWGSGKGVGSCMVLSGYVVEGKMIVLEFSVPSGCASV
jgi:hypothetical protein